MKNCIENGKKFVLFISLLTAGCGAIGAGQTAGEEEAALASDNGMSLNGVSLNGVSLNGVSLNGVSLNGLTPAGLSTTAFANWFNGNVTLSEMITRYEVKCALVANTSLSWTNPTTKVAYSWPGELGLAPGWAAGRPISSTEKQLITGCVLAHANKYGIHVPIAVEGVTATGAVIPMGANELTTYSVREAAFFGNGFDGTGFFVCLDHPTWDSKKSAARACAFDTSLSGSSTACPPVYQLGPCNNFCTLDASGTYYTSCSYGGKSYTPVTTRLQPSAIYSCGDGICQFTESCGNGADWNNCKPDCGLCR